MLKREITIRLSSSQSNARRELPVKKRQPFKGSVLTIAFLAILGLLGSVRAGAAAAASGNDPGQSTFEVHCATCHAPNGSGDSVVGKSMKIPDLRSPAVQSQPDTQLADVIANGKGLMPGFKSSLSKDEIDALVKHVHQLAGKKAVSQ
jgi:mono/diheme cytochrome c family protein